jgi:hypothetical protein
MEKIKVVVFSKDGARVLINPEPEAYEGRIYVVDPNLDEVLEIPQHEWHLTESGKIVKKQEGQLCLADCYLPPIPKVEEPKVEVVEKIEEVEVKKKDSKIALFVGIGLALLTLCAIIKECL